MSLLLSALAKGRFAISEDGVHANFPLAHAALTGKHEFQKQELPEDTFLPVVFDDSDFEDDCSDDSEAMPESDEFTGRIAVMRVTGVMMHYGGLCSYGTEDYANRINQYAADESISGLIILVDTPGGQVDGVETLRLAVQDFRAQKPLIALINDGRMCSGGVWAFIGSTEVYAANTLCEAGCIGVICTLMDIRKALEMNGIEQIIIRSPQSPDKNKVSEDALNGKPDALIAEIKFICDRFLNVVSTDRDSKLTSNEWNTGKNFFAEDAVRIGLIDGIKSYADVVARMQQLIAQNPNQNNMISIGNKLPKVAALKDAESITAESLDAANQEIEAYGIKGVTLCLDSQIEGFTAMEGLLTTAQNDASAKGLKITELEGKVTALEAKVAAKPAADVASPVAGVDAIQNTGGEPDYEVTSVDLEKARLKAQWS